MNYKLLKEDRSIYTARVQISDHMLRWTPTQGVDAFIIKTPFQKNPENDLQTIIDVMNACEYRIDIQRDDFMSLNGMNYSIYYMRSSEYIHQLGKKIPFESATYTIYPCIVKDNEINIYQQTRSIMQNYVDFKISLEIEIEKQYIEQINYVGFFRKKEISQVFSGFYRISFSERFLGLVKANFFSERDLYLKVKNFEIPINFDVMQQKTIYIKSDEKPDIKTRRDDIELIIVSKKER